MTDPTTSSGIYWLGFALTGMGGAIGAMSRYGLGGLVQKWTGSDYPWGTFAANVLGGLLMGLLMGWLYWRFSDINLGTHQSENIRLFVGVGILGGFTTFSSFSLEALGMIENKSYALAGGYMLSSVVFSLLAIWLGFIIIRQFLS